MYLFFRWAIWLVPRLPHWFLRLLPNVIGLLAWLVVARARSQAMRNAAHVLRLEYPLTPGDRRKLHRVVRGMFRNSVSNYLDALLLPALKHDEIVRRISVENQIYLEEALALGKGVILFSAHFGPFECISSWFVAHGYQVVIPVERLKDERMLKLIVKLRSSNGIVYMPLGGSTPMRSIIQALRKNQIVLITADRAVEGESVIRNFFGAPARLPIGPVHLSLRTGAPLVGAFGWHASCGQISGAFSRLTLALSEEERRQADTVEAALIKRMEQVIGERPEQWVVFEPIWVEPVVEKGDRLTG